ncbi:lipocalin-like domain-containing protein [Azohydromonas sediminis]|uniref:lipocalin-like domain-containing protein n=1 Tax=Azohydromonas sediminis TaxID=2259674 RepID=UPI000E65262D|nr:carotenoid 1,2-hydratase [Azohydromonas sediminis]
MRRRALLLALPAGALGPVAAPATPPAPRVERRALVFPRDFGAHPEFRTEWWYATGQLDAEGGAAPFGFQLTFFRSRADDAGRWAGSTSRFAPRQLLFAHAAVTDLGARRLRHAQRIARWSGDPAAAPAAAALDDTRVQLGDWRLQRSEGGPGGRYRARLGDADAGFAFELELASTQPLLLQGDAGFSRKGPQPEQASHYYSQPQLAVTGTLRLDGTRRAVRGRAWLDHEWSETLLHPEAVGWDWIGMNLDDGGALTAFQLRRADGSAVWAGGSFRAPGGAVRDFAPDAVRFTPGRTWTSAASQARYPVQWHIDTPAGRFEVAARLDAQELDSRGSTGAIYWEGLSELRDATGRRVGAGYLEMTGYAGRLQP